MESDDPVARNIAALTASTRQGRREAAEQRDRERRENLYVVAERVHQDLIHKYKKGCLSFALFRDKYPEQTRTTLQTNLNFSRKLIDLKEKTDAAFSKIEAVLEKQADGRTGKGYSD